MVESMPTLLEKWTADAVAKERTKAGAEAVLTVLRARFQIVPDEVEDTIRQISDPIALVLGLLRLQLRCL